MDLSGKLETSEFALEPPGHSSTVRTHLPLGILEKCNLTSLTSRLKILDRKGATSKLLDMAFKTGLTRVKKALIV